MDLEQQRATYAQNLTWFNEKHIDAFLDTMVETLGPGIGHLCQRCRGRMETLNWERFVLLEREASKNEGK
ncbi:MAG TPA: hypothetical protein VKR06_09175 [Ktedonosporobacter sp.]|nr:hypothetical protein [Ktedonosporobacter sp.]